MTHNNRPFYHQGHRRPLTRRELISQGFMGGVGLVWASSITTLWSQKAFGLDCSGNADSPIGQRKMPGFLCFDLAGGASIAGSNVMVGGKNGQEDFLPDYTTLGIPSNLHPKNGTLNRELGLIFHSDSAIGRGISSVTAATTRANIEGALFCSISADDTAANPHNPCYWIAKSGLSGKISALAGTQRTTSGGNAKAPDSSLDPALKPLIINSPQDAARLVNTSNSVTNMDAKTIKKIAEASKKMSLLRLKQWEAKGLAQKTSELIECGYLKSGELLAPSSNISLDPTIDTDVREVFQNNFNGDNGKTAAIAKLIIDGQVGAGTITRGGYDYHNNTRATGENADFAAGQLIGRALELAARKKTDLVIYVFTDGAVVSNGAVDTTTEGRNKCIWTSDSPVRSASFMLVYQARGKAILRQENKRQIGYFNDSGAVAPQSSRIANNVDSQTMAVVANYLALQGEEQNLVNITGKNPFQDDLQNYLVFAKQK